uniref:Uncharacterized protein n=1 Tax=Glossina austeni TaxID=7395 RepID=A0A1A9VAB0_GLOAU
MKLLLYMSKLVRNMGPHTIELEQHQHCCNTRNGSEIRVCRCRLEITKQIIEHKTSLESNGLPVFLKNSSPISTVHRIRYKIDGPEACFTLPPLLLDVNRFERRNTTNNQQRQQQQQQLLLGLCNNMQPAHRYE